MKTNLTKTDAKLAKVSKMLNSMAVDGHALKLIKLAIFDATLTAITETAEQITSGAKTLAETADVAIQRHRTLPRGDGGETDSGMKIVSYGDNRDNR